MTLHRPAVAGLFRASSTHWFGTMQPCSAVGAAARYLNGVTSATYPGSQPEA